MSFDVTSFAEERAVSACRAAAKALISTDERVLLVKERHSDGTPFWTLPGGGLEHGESYREGLKRELGEELGCRVLVGEPVDSVVYAHHSSAATVSRYTIFECTLASVPAPNPADGILDMQWVQPTAMPPQTLPQVRSLWW